MVYRVEDKNTQQIYAAKLYQFQDEEHIVNVKLLTNIGLIPISRSEEKLKFYNQSSIQTL